MLLKRAKNSFDNNIYDKKIYIYNKEKRIKKEKKGKTIKKSRHICFVSFKLTFMQFELYRNKNKKTK